MKIYEVYNWETGNWHTSGTLSECNDYIDNNSDQITLSIREI